MSCEELEEYDMKGVVFDFQSIFLTIPKIMGVKNKTSHRFSKTLLWQVSHLRELFHSSSNFCETTLYTYGIETNHSV